ncbi:MAG: helix-turn-helix domain-containing protein [Hydrococcus sp. C42_A2020_068]|nr:helix-turn-helix domain-containing protein [Hydrococcus sp. C42_A2020_068]
MARVAQINIQESKEELESLVRQQTNPRLKERLQALYMIKSQGMSVCAIALVLRKHRSTVQRWLADYRKTGIEAMLEFDTSPGRKRVIPNWAVESLNKQLEDAESGFAEYKPIQQWLKSVLGVKAK